MKKMLTSGGGGVILSFAKLYYSRVADAFLTTISVRTHLPRERLQAFSPDYYTEAKCSDLIVMFAAICRGCYLTRKKASCCNAAENDTTAFTPFAAADYETYRLTATYYNLRGGLSTTLMLNNKGGQPILAMPTFYSMAGTRLQLAPITVAAASYLDVDMHQLLAGAGDEFQEGSFKVAYEGISQQLGAQVKMVDAANNLIWAEQLVYGTKFVSSSLETVWWLPFGQTETRVAVSNTYNGTVTVAIEVEGTAPSQQGPVNITLAPWETRILDIMDDLVGRGSGYVKPEGGISITHSGTPGAVLARMFISKPSKGYSAANSFIDPATTASQRWHGNGLRLRNLDGSKLEPVMTVRNTSPGLSRIKGRIIYTRDDGTTGTVDIPQKPIAAGKTQTFSLSNLVTNLPADTAYGGIELEYDTPNGTVVTSVQSMGQNGDHVFQVPMFDPQNMPSSAGGFPWKADGDFRTIVYIKNETDTPRKYIVHLSYEGGGYTTGIKTIAAGQTSAFDFRELRDNQTPDSQGNTIPLTLDRGQIGWSVRGAENKVLSGRSEQISIAAGVASTYACANCCPNVTTDVRVIPEDEETEVGGQIPYLGNEFEQNCYSQQFGPFAAEGVDWASGQTNIASIDWGGLAEGISIGNTSIQGCIDRTIWYHFGGGYCDPAPNRLCNWAPVQVKCPPFSTNYPNAYPTNFRIKPGFPTTPGNGVLYFEYVWNSSDGVVDHLYACEIRECTRYGNTTCEQETTSLYPVPSPPYRANMGINDPTRRSGGSAAYFYMFDRHRVPGTTEENPVPEFRTPYVANSFTGMQKYQFKCPCNNGAVWTDLTPNINIVRTVSEANGIWTYTLTKSGSSVSYTLP